MAEDKGLEPDDAQYSEEEALIYISDEKHPTGSVKKAELRRERKLCFCVIGVMTCSVVLGLAVVVALVVTVQEGYFKQPHDESITATHINNSTLINAMLKVNTSVLERSGDWVLVEWDHVLDPNVSDWVGLYTVPEYFKGGDINVTERAPVKFQYANYSQTHMSEGRGSIQFRLINIRQPLAFSLFRGGLDTNKEIAHFSAAITLAVSGMVMFKNWNDPLQVHLALTGTPSEMIVTWVTNSSKSPQVKWGNESGNLNSSVQAYSYSYSASDMCGSPAVDFGYRDPGLLHRAKLTGLQPGSTYYYTCGDDQFGWSQEFSFKAASPADPDTTTRVVIYGDMGNGHEDGTWQVIRQQPGALNTSRMLKGLVPETDLVFHIGDISYARGYANVWDEFFDEIQAVSANVAYMVCIGNHERNWNDSLSYWKTPDSMGECGVPYELRFPMPRPSLDLPWYSIDYGSVHYIVMSTEHNFTQGSIQYQFLESDFLNVNRSLTPWLVVVGHRPMYVYAVNDTGYAGIQPVAKLLRDNLEDLFNEYQVDLALWGHEHAYQRTCAVYQQQCVTTGNATVHVIVGMGGQKHATGYPPDKPEWLEHFDKSYYGLSRLTANSTDLILEYIASEGGVPKVNDVVTLSHKSYFKQPHDESITATHINNSTLINAMLKVNTSVLERSGDWVLVEWDHVLDPNVSDWVGLYTVPEDFKGGDINVTERAPVKFQYANYSQTHMSEGRGSIQFRLINIRQPLAFSLFRGGLDTNKEIAHFSAAITLAVSGMVMFKNWNDPLQVHLALTGTPSEMIVTWVTNSSKSPQVKWGNESGNLNSSVQAYTYSYSASEMCGSPAVDFGYRDPGLLHRAKLTGLQPGSTYYYTCGDDQFGWSQEFSFKAASPADPDTTTRVVIYGDMGNGHEDGTWQVIRQQPGALNTSRMLKGLVPETDLVFHIGDISYARGYANVWDEFFDEIQAVSANVAYMVCIGNHERNWNDSLSYWKTPDSMGECGVPYELRFPMPRPSLDLPWYSIDYGSVHYIVMSTEHNFTQGSIQYQFLESDFLNVNRSLTPWLVVVGHRPMYVYAVNDTGYAGIQPVAKLLRDNLEDLFNEYQVDLALWGHEHAYQRTCAVYQQQCVTTGNATVHVIVGMGGQKHATGYPPDKPEWLEHFDKSYYGLSRLTANSTDLILEYIASEGGVPKVNDVVTLSHKSE